MTVYQRNFEGAERAPGTQSPGKLLLSQRRPERARYFLLSPTHSPPSVEGRFPAPLRSATRASVRAQSRGASRDVRTGWQR